MTIRIYHVSFEDGRGYVGQTRQRNYRHRLSQHRADPLGRAMRSGCEYTHGVIGTANTRERANAMEMAAIRLLPSPLNVRLPKDLAQLSVPQMVVRDHFLADPRGQGAVMKAHAELPREWGIYESQARLWQALWEVAAGGHLPTDYLRCLYRGRI